MQQLLAAQYEEIKGARGALLDYCKTISEADLQKRVPEFNDNTVLRLMGHCANTYVHWLTQLDKSSDMPFFDSISIKNIAEIQDIFKQIDQIVADFLERYRADYTKSMTETLPRYTEQITVTPLQLFTHTITHEFHHKGQILTISRLLGYTPADTDVIRF
ncbi:DinB family protein [Mucilaginibacter sp. dw_454]|uniref:DinB family protein n=1 Tax=Mucilaginibacter sp. dw_454 TaxID=2720079 RepID=UPI001BD266DB|nr:DinB family protein [Mucilaginibacter sp. dw_454]